MENLVLSPPPGERVRERGIDCSALRQSTMGNRQSSINLLVGQDPPYANILSKSLFLATSRLCERRNEPPYCRVRCQRTFFEPTGRSRSAPQRYGFGSGGSLRSTPATQVNRTFWSSRPRRGRELERGALAVLHFENQQSEIGNHQSICWRVKTRRTPTSCQRISSSRLSAFARGVISHSIVGCHCWLVPAVLSSTHPNHAVLPGDLRSSPWGGRETTP